MSSYDNVVEAILENAARDAKYKSPKIQKEILHILAIKVRDVICKEIEMTNFVFLLMKLEMSQKGEQMTIILRFVDKDGFIKERFFHIV